MHALSDILRVYLENPMRSISSLDITPEKMAATPYGLAVFGGGSENSPRGRALVCPA